MNRAAAWLSALLCAAAVLPWPSPASAADGGIQALLQQVEQASRGQAQALQAREQRFVRARDQQAALLKQAQAREKAAQARADAVRKTFEANQKIIAGLQAKLENAVGDRGQLFGAVHDAARAFLTVAKNSLVTAQYPQRIKTLSMLADGARVPSLADVRELWLLMLRQIADGGRVATFPAQVVATDGQARADQVTRVGAFIAFADGRYLGLPPGSTQLEVLRRQPGERADARGFASAKSALTPILIDPSLGKLLRQQAARPTLVDRIHQAGVIGYVIIAAGLIGLVVAIYQFLYLLGVDLRVRRQLRRLDKPRAGNPLGRVLRCLREDRPDENPEMLETRISEAVLRETPRLERFQAFLRMLVAAGPLLGLLGTVTGMIVVFQAITEVGAGDPKLMAGGISQAMVNTVLGLLVAIPLLFINSILGARSRVLIQILDEQSAGLLARRLEDRRERS